MKFTTWDKLMLETFEDLLLWVKRTKPDRKKTEKKISEIINMLKSNSKYLA